MPFVVGAIIILVDHADRIVQLQTVLKAEPALGHDQKHPAGSNAAPQSRRNAKALSRFEAYRPEGPDVVTGASGRRADRQFDRCGVTRHMRGILFQLRFADSFESRNTFHRFYPFIRRFMSTLSLLIATPL